MGHAVQTTESFPVRRLKTKWSNRCLATHAFFFSTTKVLLDVPVKKYQGTPFISTLFILIYTYTIFYIENSNIVSGLLQYVENASKFEPKYSSTVAVIEPTTLNKATVDRLMSHSKISGIAVLWKTESNATGPERYSPDAPIPNKDSFPGYTPSFAWNSNGDSLNFAHYRKPMWLLSESDSDTVRDAAEANPSLKNGHYGIAFHSRMNAGVDTATCIRRGMCLPLGGQSVISSLWNFSASEDRNSEERDVVYVTSRLDTTSMFHDLTQGSEGYMSGLIVQLAAQITLSEHIREGDIDVNELKRKLVFSYFNGEAYDYLGSRKFVYDLENFKVNTHFNYQSYTFIPIYLFSAKKFQRKTPCSARSRLCSP